MRRCIFCGRAGDVVLWTIDDVAECAVPACRSCGEEHGLRIICGEPVVWDLPEYDGCQCCGRALGGPGGWPMTVWVQDRRRLMAVCNACRVEYALPAVFTSAPPAGDRARRDPDPPGGEADTASAE